MNPLNPHNPSGPHAGHTDADRESTQAIDEARWRKSSHSNHQGNCVELAEVAGDIAFRDSKDPQGAVLIFGRDQARAFLDAVAGGEFGAG